MIQIIKSCEFLKDVYWDEEQEELRRFIDWGYDEMNKEHDQLKVLSRGQRLFYLRPND